MNTYLDIHGVKRTQMLNRVAISRYPGIMSFETSMVTDAGRLDVSERP